MAVHIPLCQRKALAGRLAFFDSALPLRSSFRPKGIARYKFLEKALLQLTDIPLHLGSSNTESMQVFLSVLADRFYIQARPLIEKGVDLDQITSILDDFRSTALGVNCDNCVKAQGQSKICDGSVADDEIVPKGLCVRPLVDLFETVLEVTRCYYSEKSTSFRHLKGLSVEMSTGFINSKPHDCPIDCFIGGKTTYQDHGGAMLSDVHLLINIERFDEESYLAVAYVLFHEIVCHAFQDTLPLSESPHPRTPSEPDDAFSEGWMDWIAFKILEEVLGEKGPAQHFARKFRFANDARDVSNAFHLARVNDRQPNASKHAVERALGKAVAERVLYLFGRLPESATDPWKFFLRLSFDLSMLPRFKEVSQRFVSLLEFSLPEAGRVETPNKTNKVPEYFRKYLLSNDLGELIQAIVQHHGGGDNFSFDKRITNAVRSI
jgi:hypothetical protein